MLFVCSFAAAVKAAVFRPMLEPSLFAALGFAFGAIADVSEHGRGQFAATLMSLGRAMLLTSWTSNGAMVQSTTLASSYCLPSKGP